MGRQKLDKEVRKTILKARSWIEQLEKKSINRRQAAERLGISGPTLKRVLDDRLAATWQASPREYD